METDFAQFSADKSLTFQPNAQRMYSRLQLTRPWQAPGWFVIPKAFAQRVCVQLTRHLSSTGRAAPARRADQEPGRRLGVSNATPGISTRVRADARASRVLRAHTPYRDQSTLPLYDTGAADFNFATIYTENPYVAMTASPMSTCHAGRDQSTARSGHRSRGHATGPGAAPALQDQRVTLPWEAPVTDRVSDILLGASVNWTRALTLDSTVQFNQHTNRSTRSVIGVRYNPGNYRTVSAAYRLQRDVSEQIDIGWQWPINDLWGDRGEDRGPARARRQPLVQRGPDQLQHGRSQDGRYRGGAGVRCLLLDRSGGA